MAEIQRQIIKQSGRNAATRLFHAKNDKETIAAWKSDLNRILQVFNVCSATSVWLFLTANFQTELAMITHVTVSDVHHGVVTTHTMVSDLHHNMVKNQEGNIDQRRSVSDICTLFHYRMNN